MRSTLSTAVGATVTVVRRSFLAALVVAAPLGAQDAARAGRSTVYAPNNIVATSQPLASSAALEIIQNGGNAFDAAVAAAAVLNVVEPHMTGIGGDMFAIAWSAEEGRLIGLDASGRSGSLMTPEALGDRNSVPGDARSITVPGALSGWNALVTEHGNLTLAEVLAPAIRLADVGYPVSPIIAGQWRAQTGKLRRNDAAAATFLIDGEAPAAGQWYRNPDLAETFRTVASEGPGALYGGALGQRIVDGVREQGGFLTLEDMANHEPRWVDPISVDYGGYTVWELPPAGQGIAALEMLAILDGFDLVSMGHNSPEYLHHLIEAKKLAYADLARYIADPDHMDVQPETLLSDDFIAARRGQINPRRAMDEVGPGDLITSSETIYLTVADAEGNMISFINSVYGYFGSGVVVPGTGIMMQNRGQGFTMEEGHPNRVAPNKRPFHTIIPGFVTRDGEPYISFGLMGGAMQPQGHTQMLISILDFGMDLQEAVDANRFRHFSGLRVAVEGVGADVLYGLTDRGHEISDPSGTSFGGAQVIMRLPGGGWAAASDPRKDGLAIGN